MKRDQDGQRPAEKKKLQKIHQIVRKNHWLSVRSTAEQVNINRETVRKILTEDVFKNGPKRAHRRTKVKKSHNLPRPFGEAR
jgi:DeoR/GlpR family transcriptional regulator of sugar metabolism